MNPGEQPPFDSTSQSTSGTASAASVWGAFMNAFNELGRVMSPPENVERHFREARKQALMGLRELIDNRIQELSRSETKGTRIVAE
jgi:hypothetical protein